MSTRARLGGGLRRLRRLRRAPRRALTFDTSLQKLRGAVFGVVLGALLCWYLLFERIGGVTLTLGLGSFGLVFGLIIALSGLVAMQERRMAVGIFIEALGGGVSAMGSLDIADPIGLGALVGLSVLIVAQYQFGAALILCRRFTTQLAWRDERTEQDIEHAFRVQLSAVARLVGVNAVVGYGGLFLVGRALGLFAGESLAVTAIIAVAIIALVVLYLVLRGGPVEETDKTTGAGMNGGHSATARDRPYQPAYARDGPGVR